MRRMGTQLVLNDYLRAAMGEAVYDKLEDGRISGRIPSCPGVIAFGATLRACEEELQSTLEEWLFVGLKLDHSLPVLAGIDLNLSPLRSGPGGG